MPSNDLLVFHLSAYTVRRSHATTFVVPFTLPPPSGKGGDIRKYEDEARQLLQIHLPLRRLARVCREERDPRHCQCVGGLGRADV